mgnify:CR=1 FL=1
MIDTLTRRETAILLGAGLMYTGVPFHRVEKRQLTESETLVLNRLEDRLIETRDRLLGYVGAPDDAISFPITEAERAIWADVLGACLEECGHSANDLSVHLVAHDREEVESLLRRLGQNP